MHDVITYNAWISACEKGKHPERELQVFEAVQQQGVVPNVVTYNPSISACEKGEHPGRDLQVSVAM